MFVRVALAEDVTKKGGLSCPTWPYTHFVTRAHVVIFYIASTVLVHLYTPRVGIVNERKEKIIVAVYNIETETAASTILLPPYSLSC